MYKSVWNKKVRQTNTPPPSIKFLTFNYPTIYDFFRDFFRCKLKIYGSLSFSEKSIFK